MHERVKHPARIFKANFIMIYHAIIIDLPNKQLSKLADSLSKLAAAFKIHEMKGRNFAMLPVFRKLFIQLTVSE